MTSDKKTAAARRVTNPVTRHLSLATAFLMAGAVALAGCKKSGDIATDTPTPKDAGHTRDFTSVEYYAAPNATRMKTRLSGAEAQPLTGELLLLKQLKAESFSTNGTLQAVVKAPECVYDMQHRTANSAGHLQLQSGDGKIRTEGDGFLWRQDDSFLTISNHHHTMIESGPGMNIGL